MASNLVKWKTLLQVLIILNLFILWLFAHVRLLIKLYAIDERLDAFSLAGISSSISKYQKFSILFGTCSFILFLSYLVVIPI